MKTRSSCGCITGAVAASKQAADKKKKMFKLWRALLFIAAISSILRRPLRPSLDLQNGIRSAVHRRPHSFVSPNNQRRSEWHSAALRGASRSWLMLPQLERLEVEATFISRNLLTWVIELRPICVFFSSQNALKSGWWRIRDCGGHYSSCNPAEVYFNFSTNLLSACARHLVPPACRLLSPSSRPTQSPAEFFLNILLRFPNNQTRTSEASRNEINKLAETH